MGPKAGNWTGQVDVGLNQSSVETGPTKPKMEEEPGWTVVDRNHDAILLIPDILSRLVKLLMLDKLPFSHEVGGLHVQTPCCMSLRYGFSKHLDGFRMC